MTRESLIVISASVLGAFFSYLFNPMLIAGPLGREGIAVLGAFIYLYFALSFPQRPAGLTISRYVSEYNAAHRPGQVATVVSKSLKKLAIYGLFFFALMLLGAKPIARYLNLASTGPVVAAVLLGYAGLLFTAILSCLQGLLRFRAYSLLWLTDPVCRLLAGLFLLRLGFGPVGAMGGYLAGYAAASLLGLWFLRGFLRRPDKEPVNHLEMVAYSVPVTVYSLYMAFVYSVDGLAAKHYFADAEAGIYVAATTIAKTVFVIIVPLANVSFSLMADAVSRRENPALLLRKVLWLTAGGCAGLALASVMLPGWIVHFTYGERFVAAIALLPYVCLSVIPPSFAFLYSHYCLAQKRKAFVYGLAAGALAHLVLLAFFHDTLRALALASTVGGLAELYLCILLDRKSR